MPITSDNDTITKTKLNKPMDHGYGVECAEKSPTDSEKDGPPFNVTVYVNGEAKVQQIRSKERAVRLKVRMYDEAFNGRNSPREIPPPSATTLEMGGCEIVDSDTFAQHDVEIDAVLVLTFDVGISVTFRGFMWFTVNGSNPVTTVWAKEPKQAMLIRALRHFMMDGNNVDDDNNASIGRVAKLTKETWFVCKSDSSTDFREVKPLLFHDVEQFQEGDTLLPQSALRSWESDHKRSHVQAGVVMRWATTGDVVTFVRWTDDDHPVVEHNGVQKTVTLEKLTFLSPEVRSV